MDGDPFEGTFSDLHLADETKVQYLDSRQGAWETLEGQLAFEKRIPSLKDLVDDVGTTSSNSGQSTSVDDRAPFIAMLALGEPTYKEPPLSISTESIRLLLSNGIFDSHFVLAYSLTQQHFSYHVQYNESQTRPVAIYIYMRLPRNSRMISLSMRIRLHDLACISIISSRMPRAISDLRSRIRNQKLLLQSHPLHLLIFVLERRKQDFDNWIEVLWKHVSQLEAKTGMAPWHDDPHQAAASLESPAMTTLLQKLHAVGVELRLAQTLISFARGLGPQFITVARKLEGLRADIGAKQFKPGVKNEFELEVEFNITILDNMREKILESLGRANAQIQVTYSLIAQKSSEQNIRIAQGSRDIAELTRDDSRTMKTITVLTLVFLPSTMLASLWDAGIFTLDADKSWRVYIGTTFALTLLVFCIWYLYIWISNKQRLRERLIPRVDSALEKGKLS